MIYKLKYYSLFFLILIVGCSNPNDKIKKEAAKIPLDLKIIRFEQQLFKNPQRLGSIEQQFPAFFNFYCTQILRIKEKQDSGKYLLKLDGFIHNEAVKGLYDTSQKHFGNFTIYEKALHDAFQLHQYYLPNEKVPTVYTYISEFGYGAIPSNNMLGIGLDLFLGEQYPFYRSPQIDFPNFLIRKCTPQNMVPSAMKVWANYIIKADPQHQRLIDKMIEQGKILYYLDKVMPDLPDSLKLGYSDVQSNWCERNSFKIWEYFIKHDLLYQSDLMQIGSFVNDGPVTPGMPPDAPGNIGSWTGWQIVKKYMEENPKITMKALFDETDGQKILTASHYKPKKK